MSDPSFESVKAVPKTHRAAVSEHVGDYPATKYIDTPDASSLAPGKALVRIVYAGVCHTDVSITLGTGTDQPVTPIIPGHEGAGYVVAVGPHAAPGPEVVKVGDRVGIRFVADICGNCDGCLDGEEESCDHLVISGTNTPGVFQEFIVAPASQLTPIPDAVPLSMAAPILCAGLTTYKALLNANLKAGDWVVIPGAGGGLGHLAVQYALAMNYRVCGIDVGDDKLAMLKGYGIHAFVDFTKESDVPAAVKRAVGEKGAKAAVVAAGVIAPYQQALDYLGFRSTLVCVGLPKDGKFTVDSNQLVVQSSRIVGSSVGTRADAKRALALVELGKVKVELSVRDLDEVGEIFKELKGGKVKGRVVVKLF
ncbi:mannitol-1-phosphate dehydrogenase MPDH1 [Papiliotrema laurentii]|uniref:alcohol dehydrogenase n=1 Tax=Papiliotrema laurentii TaxID=5418 RepID=A0AAD9FUN5_PAPLA|nr:mannitol-1-phosphate dehydrogenase MPDH1 [Papiliotrema laurentii]